jgi:predicted phosphodiesterase
MKVAIIADTHINPQDDASSSVYRVHANANRRVQAVIEKINTLDVDLVVHLGDFVHRIQGQPLRAEAIRRFREIMGVLRPPLLLAPGNHDEGEKVTPWAPGHPVTAATLRQYRADFGADYHFKDLASARFIVLNSQLFGCEDDEERAQLAFLRAALQTPNAKYVFQHHPFYLESRFEREHYDNLPLNVRERYLPLLTGAGVKAIFAGHVHNYFFNIAQDTHLFVVPSTTFVRHDYSELLPFVPTDEAHGRNYVAKLGFFLLEVIGDGSVVTWIRTFGCADPPVASKVISVPAANLLRGDRAALGVDLRHDWATPRPVPYTALQDEFNRKLIRNDNFTASIFETAIALLRIPIQDVEELKSRERMIDLARVGIRFIVFLYEHPTPSQVSLLNSAKEAIWCVEICAPMARIDAVSAALARCGLDGQIPLGFCEMGTSAAGNEPMAHYIWTGFDAKKSTLNAHLAAVRTHGFASAVLRIERTAASALEIQRIADAAAAASAHVIIYARLASTNGAEALTDDNANARLVSTLEIMGRLRRQDITIVTDTYADHDRGYYPRTGIVDRAYDLRSPGTAIGRITGLLRAEKLTLDDIKDEAISFRSAGSAYLFIPNPVAISPITRESLVMSIKKSMNWRINRLCSPHGWVDAEKNGDPAEVTCRISRTAEPILLVSRKG